MIWNKRKKKITALEALIKSTANTLKVQQSEIEALERANNRLVIENDNLRSERRLIKTRSGA